MLVSKNELFAVLQEYNPWWLGQPIADLPNWERSAIVRLREWVGDQKSKRALVLTGARQVGKTTLLRQVIRGMIAGGHRPTDILFATFDHPLLKLAGLKKTLDAWDELYPQQSPGRRFLFLDEIQYAQDWQTWLKHQVDFQGGRRIAVTGSASPLQSEGVESGVGRWMTVPLPTLSFGEYLRLRDVPTPALPTVNTLRALFEWTEGDFARVRGIAPVLTRHFNEYLLRGGFPEPALSEELERCQRLLREDIVDKVLKRDMTALYGVRKILEAEKIFLYLCYHNGGILDMGVLSRELDGFSKNMATNLLDLFESVHLIYRLKPFGYGKEVLRGKDKVYMADAAIPGSVLLLGRRLLEQPDRLGAAVESAFFKHVVTWLYPQSPKFSYWQDKSNRNHEVDLVVETSDRLVPMEVKYQDRPFSAGDFKGLRYFLEEHDIRQGYVINQRWEDFGLHRMPSARKGQEKSLLDTKVLSIPAALACYWLSQIRTDVAE